MYKWVELHFFSCTFTSDFRTLTVISNDLGVIFEVSVKLSLKKAIVKEIEIDHGCSCLVCLYSIEITFYRSGFLEYKLTRVNSVPHGRPWWILYFLCSQRHECWCPGSLGRHDISIHCIDLYLPEYPRHRTRQYNFLHSARRPAVQNWFVIAQDWGCGAVVLLSRGEFAREKNKICYQRGGVWTFCYMPNFII